MRKREFYSRFFYSLMVSHHFFSNLFSKIIFGERHDPEFNIRIIFHIDDLRSSL